MNYRHLVTNFANIKVNSEFAWGDNDCNTLALDYIDFALPNLFNVIDLVRGEYTNRKQAIKFYRNFEFTWLEYLNMIGFYEVPINFFQPGDLHIHKMGKRLEAVSINLGSHNLIADEELGIGFKDFFELKEEYALKGYRYKE